MKKLGIVALFITLFCFTQATNAQTYHQYVTGTVTNGLTQCGIILNGEFTLHMSYHIDKEGYFSRLHWNVVKCNLYDQYGNKFRYIDSGNDNIGVFWEFFNNLNQYNADYGFVYDPDDGFLPLDNMAPYEGTLVNNIRMVSKGIKVMWTFYSRVQLDKDGQIKVDIYDETVECK